MGIRDVSKNPLYTCCAKTKLPMGRCFPATLPRSSFRCTMNGAYAHDRPADDVLSMGPVYVSRSALCGTCRPTPLPAAVSLPNGISCFSLTHVQTRRAIITEPKIRKSPSGPFGQSVRVPVHALRPGRLVPKCVVISARRAVEYLGL